MTASPTPIEKVRLDKYLWAIRIFKTRTQATTAIEDGKVKFMGENIKPSKNVSIGEVYDIRTEARKWVIEVTALIDNRVGYQDAVKNYKDITPIELLEAKKVFYAFNTGKRRSKIGRPTKKDRRQIDDVNDVFDLE